MEVTLPLCPRTLSTSSAEERLREVRVPLVRVVLNVWRPREDTLRRLGISFNIKGEITPDVRRDFDDLRRHRKYQRVTP